MEYIKKDDSTISKVVTETIDISITELVEERNVYNVRIADEELNRDLSVLRIQQEYNDRIAQKRARIDEINAMIEQAKTLGVRDADGILTVSEIIK